MPVIGSMTHDSSIVDFFESPATSGDRKRTLGLQSMGPLSSRGALSMCERECLVFENDTYKQMLEVR